MSGLLGDLLKQFGGLGLATQPQLQQNELVITITQEELDRMAKKDLDPRAKNSIFIELHEGKMVIRVRLW